ncbi:MAG: tripartite tricarboxylate transporter substrate binding protein [Burkholderiales bacterium]
MKFKITPVVAALAAVLNLSDAHAQVYPTKPVRMVNPFSPGGSLDLVSRALARTMTIEFGQSVYVDNRPGAGGNLGVEIVAKAPPDGYTLLAMQSSMVINPSLQKQVPYDPVRDFEPISKISAYMFFLVVHPSTQARSVQQLIALAKAKPDQLTYASVGIGSGTHLAGELFKSMTGTRMIHVPYKGSGPSIIDLVGGQVALMFGSTSVLPHVQTKKLVLLGVSGAKRSNFVPGTPTIAESGVPGFEVTAWNALFAPAGTPAVIVARLNQLVRQGLANPDTKMVMEAQGLDATPSTPQELGDLVKAELPKWAKIIKTAGIRPE